MDCAQEKGEAAQEAEWSSRKRNNDGQQFLQYPVSTSLDDSQGVCSQALPLWLAEAQECHVSLNTEKKFCQSHVCAHKGPLGTFTIFRSGLGIE